MDRLPRIPTPPWQLWREFRVGVLPVLVFGAAVATVTLMWQENVMAPRLIGEVETVHSSLSSPKGGKLSQLTVCRLQRVKAGDVIAQVITTDPQILQSSLAVIQAEIQLLRVNLDPILGQERLGMSYDRLRLDWLDQRVQLVTARVRLELADSELRRTEELFKDKVVSQQVLDSARSSQVSLKAEVDERTRLAVEQEQKLKSLGLADGDSAYPQQNNPEEVMKASIKVQEEKLRLTEIELSPIVLTVSMDATVSAIHHRSGEAITAFEPIVTLAALNSDRILSYVRQPMTFEPKIGMKVEVRARSFKRVIGQAAIVQVGSQMEPISASLSPITSAHLKELGLPVLVSLPPTQKFLPGEIVDLRILPGTGPAEAPVAQSGQMR